MSVNPNMDHSPIYTLRRVRVAVDQPLSMILWPQTAVAILVMTVARERKVADHDFLTSDLNRLLAVSDSETGILVEANVIGPLWEHPVTVVMVAGRQNQIAATKLLEQRNRHGSLTHCCVTNKPQFVAWPDNVVAVIDQCLIHGWDIWDVGTLATHIPVNSPERAVGVLDDVCVAEVPVACPESHDRSFRLCQYDTRTGRCQVMAEEEGFEPPGPGGPTAFKAV